MPGGRVAAGRHLVGAVQHWRILRGAGVISVRTSGKTRLVTLRRDELDARRVALLLPGGFLRSRRGPLKVAELGLRELTTELTGRGRPRGLAVHLLRYRYSGWNGTDADTAVDTRWALDELARRHPGAPVVLIGNSLGGRAAFWCAGHPSVVGVAGIAPWLPSGDAVGNSPGAGY